MRMRMEGQLFNDLAQEYAGDYEEDFYAGYEADAFDPTPPPPGTILLTHFAFGGAALTVSHRATIARIAADIARQMPATPQGRCFIVETEGHEDEMGDPARFGQLGIARALAVAQRLRSILEPRILRLPTANRRHVHIAVTTAGPTRPVRSNVTAPGRAMNRRVEIRVSVDVCPGTIMA